MNKEEMLRKSFSQAASNAAIRYADKEVDFLVVKAEMVAFAKKHQVEVEEKEIEDYIKAEFHKFDEALKDFTFQTRMMK